MLDTLKHSQVVNTGLNYADGLLKGFLGLAAIEGNYHFTDDDWLMVKVPFKRAVADTSIQTDLSAASPRLCW